IRVHAVRVGDKTPRGFRREDFLDAWERFFPASRPDATSATSATPEAQSQANVADVADVADGRQVVENRFCDVCVSPRVCSMTRRCVDLDRRTAEYNSTKQPSA